MFVQNIAELRNGGEKTTELPGNRGDQSEREAAANTYLTNDVSQFFPSTLEGQDDRVDPPRGFLIALSAIAASDPPVPQRAPFQFESTMEAASHNAKLIQESDCDLSKLITSHGDSTIGYGSEFRPVSQLSTILESLTPKL